MPKISVLVCTYNRADSLKDLLNCLLIQELKEGFEVIVVDNNSKDNTKELVGSFESKFNGRLRYFFEPRQGKPHALNLGIKEAHGEIIVFTDDDCLIKENYLSNIYGTFQKNGNEIGVVGGKVAFHWINDIKPPEWFVQLKPGSEFDGFFKGPLGMLDYGDKPFVIDYFQNINKNRHFFGANISIRKEPLDRHGYFNTETVFGQDTEICLRLFNAGVKGMYAPDVIVHHKVNARKITPHYYYHWHYLRGIYKEFAETWEKKFFYPFGIPTWFIRQNIVSYLKSFFEKDQHIRIHSRCLVFFNLGRMKRSMRSTHA